MQMSYSKSPKLLDWVLCSMRWDLFSVIGGPCKFIFCNWGPLYAVTPTRMPGHDCPPGPHAAEFLREAAMWQNARFRSWQSMPSLIQTWNFPEFIERECEVRIHGAWCILINHRRWCCEWFILGLIKVAIPHLRAYGPSCTFLIYTVESPTHHCTRTCPLLATWGS
jgi:hypothetical protein